MRAFLFTILFLINLTAFGQGPIAYYPFNGNANDASGNGNNGTIYGASFNLDRFGSSNSAIETSLGSDLVCSTIQYSNPTTFSYSVWFKSTPNTDIQNSMLATFDNGQCDHGFYFDRSLVINENEIKLYIYDGVEKYLVLSENYLDQKWHNAVVTFGASGANLYIDGILKANDPTLNSAQAYSGYWRVGGLSPNSANNTFVGYIDDVKFYDRILSSTEVNTLYHENSWDPLSNGLVAYYPFSGDATDASGNGNDGTLGDGVTPSTYPTLTTDRFGNANSAYGFDGLSSYIDCGDFIDFENTLNISGWYNLQGTPPNQPWVAFFLKDGYIPYFGLMYNNDDKIIRIYDNNSTYGIRDLSIEIPYNEWFFISLDYNGSIISVYYNNQLLDSFSYMTNITDANNFIIGANDAVSYHWYGQIDDVRIYNRTLTTSEIQTLYQENGWDINNINAFSLAEQTEAAVIDTAAHTVVIEVAYGTDVTALVPTFMLSSGATATISTNNQISGSTANDFTNPVTYTITAEDGITTQDWTVTVTVDDGLVAYYPFNGDATDASGNGNNGTLGDGVTTTTFPTLTTDRFGNANSAYSFDGVDDWIELIASNQLNITNSMSVSLWTAVYGLDGILLSNYDGFAFEKGDLRFFWLKSDSLVRVQLGQGSSIGISSITYDKVSLNDGNIHNILYTFDETRGIDNKVEVWIDGKKYALSYDQNGDGSIILDNAISLRIGGEYTGQFTNGVIDDVRIYSRALSASEIQTLYHENGWDINNINAFSLAEQTEAAVIDTTAHTIDIEVAYGTDVTALVPTFTLSPGATATISTNNQISGSTANDFTNPVTYTITAEDGTTKQDWTITVIIDDGLRAYFPFNGNSNDESGNGNDGTLGDGVTTTTFPTLTTDRFGNANSAYSFDGVDDWIETADIDPGNTFTYSAWIKTLGGTGQRDFLTKSNQVEFYIHPTDKLGWFVNGSGTTNVVDTNTFGNNEWHHVVGIYDNGAQELYLDGLIVGSETNSIGASNNINLAIGVYLNDIGNPTSFFNGIIDDVRIYSRALSASEIQALYQENGWDITNINTFSLAEQTEAAVIDTAAHTVAIEVAYGTDATALVPTFTLSPGATATISTNNQISGSTANDFTNPVTYTITAEDGITTQDWTITVIIDDGLVAYYPFSGDATDESGNGNDGTLGDGVTTTTFPTLTTDRFGNANSAYSFDGVDDWIVVPSSASLKLDNEFTICAWVKIEDFDQHSILSKGATSALYPDYALTVSNNNGHGWFEGIGDNSGTSRIVSKKNIELNQYNFLTYQFNGADSISLFVNGIKDSTVTISLSSIRTSDLDLYIGAWRFPDDANSINNLLNGTIDDIRIYNRALSASEILALYQENGWDNVPPVISNQNLPTVYDAANSLLSVSVTISDNIAVNSVSFMSKWPYQNSYTMDNVIGNAQNVYTVNLTKDMVSDATLQYYFLAEDAAGNKDSTTLTQIALKYDEASSPPLPLASGGDYEDWRMFSIPHILENNSIATVLENRISKYNKEDWRLMHYVHTPTPKFLDYGEGGLTTIERGKGYWFNSRKQVNLKVGASTSPQNNRNNLFEMNLVAGWNQIGNPYTIDVLWQDVLVKNGLTSEQLEPLRVYNGGTELENATVLKKFSGAYVQSDATRTIVIPLEQHTGGRLAATAEFDEGWLASIRLATGGITNQYTGLGMHPEAKQNHDGWDRIRVPRFIKYIDGSFSHPEYHSPNFARDIVEERTTYTWEFTVSSNMKGSARTISWDIINRDNLAGLVLVDLTNGNIIDMLNSTSYSYYGDEDRKFKAIYGNKNYLITQLEGNSISLGENYPNPFTGKTVIPYAIYGAESAYQYALKIYSIDGKVVNTLLSETKPTGSYQLDWDGRDEAGKPLIGMFIYSLEVNTPTGIKTYRKKLIVR